jgi:hypothetical protein
MAERKKGSKVQKRGKLRRGNSAKRGKARKVAKTAKRTAARAKPKPAPVKNAARKVKQPDAVVEVIERPAPGVIAVTEVEETEVRKASWRCCDLTATLRKNYALPSRDWLTPLDLGRTMLALRFCLFLFVCFLFVICLLVVLKSTLNCEIHAALGWLHWVPLALIGVNTVAQSMNAPGYSWWAWLSKQPRFCKFIFSFVFRAATRLRFNLKEK